MGRPVSVRLDDDVQATLEGVGKQRGGAHSGSAPQVQPVRKT
jgi:hypothetical protein